MTVIIFFSELYPKRMVAREKPVYPPQLRARILTANTWNPALLLTSCVTMSRLPNLSDFKFLTCKMWILKPYPWRYYSFCLSLFLIRYLYIYTHIYVCMYVYTWVGKIPWRKKWQPTPEFLSGRFHGQRSLAGYSPWGCQELDTTEWLSTHIHLHITTSNNTRSLFFS